MNNFPCYMHSPPRPLSAEAKRGSKTVLTDNFPLFHEVERGKEGGEYMKKEERKRKFKLTYNNENNFLNNHFNLNDCRLQKRRRSG